MPSSHRSSRSRRAAPRKRLLTTLLLAIFLAAFAGPSFNVVAASLQRSQAPLIDSSSDAASPSPIGSSARTSTAPLYATEALAQTRKPWLITAKDAVIDRISSFLGSTLPDPRYFSYDLDQFDDARDDTALASGLFDETSGLHWGGSTLEVVRSQAIFLTRAAAFGPRIVADEGLKGSLLPISTFYHMPADAKEPSTHDMHACPYKGGPGWKREGEDGLLSRYDDADDRRLYSSFLPQQETAPRRDPKLPIPPQDWIALVERGGGCGFAEKVRVAQKLGAIAVVVGDAPSPEWPGEHSGNPDEEGDPGLSSKRLITMYAPGPTDDIRIPSTFVTRPSFLDLSRLIDELEKDEQKWQDAHRSPDSGGRDRPPQKLHGLEIVISKDDMMFEWPLIDLGIILLLLPSFMTVATVIVHRIRMARQRRKERAPELVVHGLPCLIWRSGGQPWEKIEGPDVDPGPGNGGPSAASDADAAIDANGRGDVPSPVTSLNPGDLESGTAAENIPLLQEDENGAGPSRRPTSTIKVPPPPAASSLNRSHSNLPPGRTYFSTDECAICLCDFVDGDRVRVLPCGHIFHRQEIDDWLVRVKKLCPICKRDITVPIPPAPPGPPIHQASGSSSNLDVSVIANVEGNGSVEAASSAAATNAAVRLPSEHHDDGTPTMERY